MTEPAFPQSIDWFANATPALGGMSLHDWYVGMAMAGRSSAQAFREADNVMAERERRRTQGTQQVTPPPPFGIPDPQTGESKPEEGA